MPFAQKLYPTILVAIICSCGISVDRDADRLYGQREFLVKEFSNKSARLRGHKAGVNYVLNGKKPGDNWYYIKDE